MTPSEWTHTQEINGQFCFAVAEFYKAFETTHSRQGIKTTLSRMVRKGRIQCVFKGFYVIIPIKYQLTGQIPPVFYVDELMKHLHKPYYVGLETAVELLIGMHCGASYLAGKDESYPVKSLQIITEKPFINTSERHSEAIFYYRAKGQLEEISKKYYPNQKENPKNEDENEEIPEVKIRPKELVSKVSTVNGTINCACVELTAVDLVQFADQIGGYQRAVRCLEEFVDTLDDTTLYRALEFASLATIQRLGFILEFVFGQQQLADTCHQFLRDSRRKYNRVFIEERTQASTVEIVKGKEDNVMEPRKNRWRVHCKIHFRLTSEIL